MPETVLSNVEKTLIQALLSRGPLGADIFHDIFKDLTSVDPSVNASVLDECLRRINKELSSFQFDLRACKNQYDGKVYYGVVNTVSDEQSKLGTRYTVPQITFYKAIIEAIVQDSDVQGSISKFQALNVQMENQAKSQSQSEALPYAFRSFSMTQKEKTLEELASDKWLCITIDGNVRLGVRSFLDLRSWFRSNEVAACEVCNEAAVKAEMCPNDGCTIRIHKYCLIKKYYRKKVRKDCPGCGKEWDFSLSEEESTEYGEGMNGASQRQSSGEPQKKRLRVPAANVAETGPSQTSTPSNLRRSTRSSEALASNEPFGSPSQPSGPSQSKRHRTSVAGDDSEGPSDTINLRRSTRNRAK